MVTIDDVKGPKMSKGVLLALMSAFFYASYLVLVKRKSDTEEKVDIPLFFGKFKLNHLFYYLCLLYIYIILIFARFCRTMEFTFNVASIFRIKLHPNWSIRIAESSPIFNIIFERIHRHCSVGSTMAVVICSERTKYYPIDTDLNFRFFLTIFQVLLSDVIVDRNDWHYVANSVVDAVRCDFQK